MSIGYKRWKGLAMMELSELFESIPEAVNVSFPSFAKQKKHFLVKRCWNPSDNSYGRSWYWKATIERVLCFHKLP